MSIKQWYIKRRTQWLATFSRFPLATALLVFIVLLTLVTISSEGDLDYMTHVLSAGLGVLLLVGVQIFSERRSLKTSVVLGTKVFSLLLPFLYYFYLRQAPMGYSQSGQVRTMVLYFILTVLLVTIPSFLARLSFSDSLIIYIKAFFSSLLISVILFIGISAILSAYTTLILELDYRWFAYSGAIVFLFVAPVYFLSRLPIFNDREDNVKLAEAKQIPALLEILIAYIIIPVLLVFSGILIVYILTNITGDFWQDNLMEPMLISYTIVGIVTLFLAENVDKKITHVFNRFYPYLLLVVALFQTLSSSLKTAGFGLTHGRYFVLLFGIFSIISTLIYSFMTSKKRVIPFLLIGLGIVSVLPMIDAVSIGIRNQLNKADNIAQPYISDDGTVSSLDEHLSDEEKARFSYSMNYLNQQNQIDRLTWLPDNFNYYPDFESHFGFNSNFHYYYLEDQELPGRDGPRYAFLELDHSEPLVISTEDADEVIDVRTLQMNSDTFVLSRDPFSIAISAGDGSVNVALLEDAARVLEVDLSDIIDLAWEDNISNPQQPLSAMQATAEDDRYSLTVIVRRLEIQDSSYVEGEFLILVNYD